MVFIYNVFSSFCDLARHFKTDMPTEKQYRSVFRSSQEPYHTILELTDHALFLRPELDGQDQVQNIVTRVVVTNLLTSTKDHMIRPHIMFFSRILCQLAR
jgi:hypothetical protein